MAEGTPTRRVEDFDLHSPLLFSIAYRMLGSVADVEDVVQEAYLRWQEASETEVRSPRAYLSTVVTRLCEPGIIGYYADGQPQSVTTFDVAEERIRAIRILVNPEKLQNIPLVPVKPSREGEPA